MARQIDKLAQENGSYAAALQLLAGDPKSLQNMLRAAQQKAKETAIRSAPKNTGGEETGEEMGAVHYTHWTSDIGPTLQLGSFSANHSGTWGSLTATHEASKSQQGSGTAGQYMGVAGRIGNDLGRTQLGSGNEFQVILGRLESNVFRQAVREELTSSSFKRDFAFETLKDHRQDLSLYLITLAAYNVLRREQLGDQYGVQTTVEADKHRPSPFEIPQVPKVPGRS